MCNRKCKVLSTEAKTFFIFKKAYISLNNSNIEIFYQSKINNYFYSYANYKAKLLQD